MPEKFGTGDVAREMRAVDRHQEGLRTRFFPIQLFKDVKKQRFPNP
jgi:hypothetical protein